MSNFSSEQLVVWSGSLGREPGRTTLKFKKEKIWGGSCHPILLLTFCHSQHLIHADTSFSQNLLHCHQSQIIVLDILITNSNCFSTSNPKLGRILNDRVVVMWQSTVNQLTQICDIADLIFQSIHPLSEVLNISDILIRYIAPGKLKCIQIHHRYRRLLN